jgi:hypothetical protein
MGGYRSGRRYHYTSKDTVDGLTHLDVNPLNRKGYLCPGSRFVCSWTRNGEPAGWVTGETTAGLLWLRYRVQSHGGEWESVEQPTPLEWTPCRYGGRRAWFRCPAAGCGRRVAKLYGAGKYFLCRKCYDLTYESQREHWGHRALRRAQNIRMRLGGSANMLEPFPAKPKRMHWRTYERLCDRACEAEHAELAYLAALLERPLPERSTRLRSRIP